MARHCWTLCISLLFYINPCTIYAHPTRSDALKSFPSVGSPLDFFSKDDALDITWYHGANSLDQMQEALDGEYHMLEGDIILRWYGFPNQTDEPVMAHPPEYNSDNTLDNWLNSILMRTDKAPKLDFKGEDVIEPALQMLASKASMVQHPIWANADIVQGPGTINQPIDPDSFLLLVNTYYPNMTLSVGWTTGCCQQMFTRAMMEDMWAIVHNISQPCTFPARAALLKDSWIHFKWLLEKDPTRFSITVWTPSGANFWEGATPYDLLYVRNDIDKRLIYYDLPGQRFADFRRLCITAGSPLNHFDLDGERDALVITWSHGVNSQQLLDEALNRTISEEMMLEADVVLEGFGTVNQTNTPIMAHPPDIYSDITLEQWVTRVIDTKRGMKLDFKTIEVLEPSMLILSQFLGQYQQPVWINSDIFKGPNAFFSTPVNATEFKRIVLEHFPESTWSIGWTTGDGIQGYTREMVDEMLAFTADLDQPITFPIRASLARKSWDNLRDLLDVSRSHTMTLWYGSDNMDPDDLVYVRQNSDIDRVYYDLPDTLMDDFLERLNMTSDASDTWRTDTDNIILSAAALPVSSLLCIFASWFFACLNRFF